MWEGRWSVSAGAQMRREATGALRFVSSSVNAEYAEATLIRFGQLPTVVSAMAGGRSLEEALQMSDVPRPMWRSYWRAVLQLIQIRFLVPRDEDAGQFHSPLTNEARDR